MSNSETILEQIKPGDILLSRKSNSPISRIIESVTKSYWSHAFLYLGDGKIIESHWYGVAINPLEHYLNKRFSVGLFRIDPELTEDETIQLIQVLRKKAGIRYGYLQIIYQFFLRMIGKSEDPDWSLDVTSGMICSELISWGYEKIGRPLKDLDSSQMEPVDLDDSPHTIRII